MKNFKFIKLNILTEFKKIFLFSYFISLCGCQMTYYVKSAYHQLLMLSQKEKIEKALQNPELSDEQKRKIQLAEQAKVFADEVLHLNAKKNYNHFVLLNQPYVTYVVNASEKWELKNYLWNFAFIGDAPYKGFFKESDALDEQKNLQEKGLDTFVRGVSAYSTLGWFDDPLLSSMLEYSDHDLVNTIIHESVHATLYIKNSADFNERMAVYIGQIGMEMFFKKLEGENSPTLKQAELESQDDQIFNAFMQSEIKSLDQWYKSVPTDQRQEPLREEQFKSIQSKFISQVLPKLKTETYKNFSKTNLNNARLGLFKTYNQDLHLFEKLFISEKKNFDLFLEKLKKLKGSSEPEKDLEKLAVGVTT